MKKLKKVLIAIILLVVVFFIFKYWKSYEDGKKMAALVGPRTGAVVISKSSPTDPWNTVDVSKCKMLNTDSKLVSGLWMGPWDGSVNRTLAPDMNAVYYQTFLPILPEETFGKAHFEIDGQFPEARFMSYHLYNEKFVLEGDSHLSDSGIKPDPGSVNPFITGYPIPAGKDKNYTLILNDFKKLDDTGSNVLFGGVLANGDKVQGHSIMIRYYDPKRSDSALPGLVNQPKIIFKYLDSDPLSADIKDNPCLLMDSTRYVETVSKVSGLDAFAVSKVDKFKQVAGKHNYPGYLPADQPGYEKPEWLFGGNMVCTISYLFPSGFVSSALDEFSMKFAGVTPKEYAAKGQCGPEFGRGAFNYDNRYIFSFLDATRGTTIMRMKYLKPATYGQNMTKTDNDVRYWSLCVIQAENVMYTYGCAKDDQFVKDKTDPNYVTFIFSTDEDKSPEYCDVTHSSKKPSDANCKYNWFPYVSPVTWLYMRTIMPNPVSPSYQFSPFTFDLMKEAKGDPNDFQALQAHMGQYYPAGEYCTFDKTKTNEKACDEVLKTLGSEK